LKAFISGGVGVSSGGTTWICTKVQASACPVYALEANPFALARNSMSPRQKD
jgi:hypothetical protein